jgi:hypothetical protein
MAVRQLYITAAVAMALVLRLPAVCGKQLCKIDNDATYSRGAREISSKLLEVACCCQCCVCHDNPRMCVTKKKGSFACHHSCGSTG